ncbi:MAG: ATP-binding protein [Rhodospirillales bacterium]|nr:ATP-binding protein [Rhodospirillales bacterium]
MELEQKSKDILTFTVDSALLKELGERLVGKAHIALAELVKNAYDADALACKITFGNDTVEIVDNGHGMGLDDFTKYWMRVGTTHKQQKAISPELERPMTGSKGVGRLAVQFLAHKVHIETTAKGSTKTLLVDVDWDSAVEHEYLTEATAEYELVNKDIRYTEEQKHGFRIILSGLQQEWDSASLAGLAKEVWTLRPPFDGFAGKGGHDKAKDFRIHLIAPSIPGSDTFETQVKAAIGLWIAKIEGKIENGWKTQRQLVTVTFKDGTTVRESFPIENCQVDNATWEIRIFNLSGHLGQHIKVGDAREYFSEFGGVHVYDGPFRLPYYGIQQDWLGLEYDHSHRKVKSKLLPDHYHVERALNDLPTQGRILGVVRVDTGHEMQRAPKNKKSARHFLKMQVTRDRLQINTAYEQLRNAVRLSLDLYAVESMRRNLEQAKYDRPDESADAGLEKVQHVLVAHKAAIPEDVYHDLTHELSSFVDTAKREQNYRDVLAAMLGPLATAGMAALALDHEMGRELSVLDNIALRIKGLSGDKRLSNEIYQEMCEWIARIRRMRQVFEPLADKEDRETISSLRAERVLKLAQSNLSPFLGGVDIDFTVDEKMRLPYATLAEWHGLFQNVITNALNAMVETRGKRQLRISSGRGPGLRAWVRISDNGSGIDLSHSEDFFEPFKRKGDISKDRKSMGLGGHGLGLTIVRMIAENRKCRARFIEPESGFSTTFELSWSAPKEK